MPDQSQGKMFLAAARGHTETGWFRSYNTFNFGNYQHAHKSPFGPLYVLNDDTLAGGKGIRLLVEEDTTVILLPTVGAVLYKDSMGNENLVEAGQAQLWATPKNTTVEIENPFENDLVNFLHLWIKTPAAGTAPRLLRFDLENNRNKLTGIAAGNGYPACFIGKFTGRQEAVYTLTDQQNGLFVFVLEGAFEVQYRLLETRDGLALWNLQKAELEALSDDAIILLVEVPLAGQGVV